MNSRMTGLLALTLLIATDSWAGNPAESATHDTFRQAIAAQSDQNWHLERIKSESGQQMQLLAAVHDPGSPRIILRLDSHQISNHGQSWRGRIQGWSESSVVLSSAGEAIAGAIYVGTDSYVIRPAGAGVVQIQPFKTRADGCESVHAPAQSLATSPPNVAPANTPPRHAIKDSAAEIDILVLYSQPAEAYAGSVEAIQAIAMASVESTNLAFSNSGVSTRLNLVAIEAADYAESGDSGDDLDWMQASPRVEQLREAHHADLVAMLVDLIPSCGRAFIMNDPGPGFSDSAYSISAADCAVAGLTFAHEVGHNLGMQHNPEDTAATPDIAAYPAAFGHWHNGRYRTVMSIGAVCFTECERIPWYSNPEIIIDDRSTGIPGERDNATTIRNSAPIVANFMQNPNTAFASENPLFPARLMNNAWAADNVPRQGMLSANLLGGDAVDATVTDFSVLFTNLPDGTPGWLVLQSEIPPSGDSYRLPVFMPTGDLSDEGTPLVAIGVAEKSLILSDDGIRLADRLMIDFDFSDAVEQELSDMLSASTQFDPDYFSENPFHGLAISQTFTALLPTTDSPDVFCDRFGQVLFDPARPAQGRLQYTFAGSSLQLFGAWFGYQDQQPGQALLTPTWQIIDNFSQTDAGIQADGSSTNARYSPRPGNGFMTISPQDPGIDFDGLESMRDGITPGQVTIVDIITSTTSSLSRLASNSFCGPDR